MRITLKRTQDGRTPQTALPVAYLKMVYMHYEERPTFVVDDDNSIYHQSYVEMWAEDDLNPVYIRSQWTPLRDVSPRREWYCAEHPV